MSSLNLVDVLETNAINNFKVALDDGADINGLDGEGWTALQKASRGGYKRMVIFLLENGADATIKDKQGYDALFYATYEKRDEIVEILINHLDKLNK